MSGLQLVCPLSADLVLGLSITLVVSGFHACEACRAVHPKHLTVSPREQVVVTSLPMHLVTPGVDYVLTPRADQDALARPGVVRLLEARVTERGRP